MIINDWDIFTLLIVAIFFMVVLSWLIISNRKITRKASQPAPVLQKNKKQEKPLPKISIFESFDYLGTKIYHNDGKYTVVEDDVSRNFSSLNQLPLKYRKMIQEMESRNFSGQKKNYFMENKNGKYSITFPDGTTKNYKRYGDIPERLKKILAE
ncbi:MAG: hypothetical protein OEV66_05665 [Spirochaetia bacterium]|nr:hypothetical protein [Spirochaetia bacterium]